MIYWRAEQKCRKYTRTMVVGLVVYDQFSYLYNFIYATYSLCIGNYDQSTWPAPMDLAVPFDKNTIYGWYLLTFMLMYLDLSYLLSSLLGVTHFIGCCYYIAAVCEHYELVLKLIQESIEENQRETNRHRFQENTVKIREQIKEIIPIHYKIYE